MAASNEEVKHIEECSVAKSVLSYSPSLYYFFIFSSVSIVSLFYQLGVYVFLNLGDPLIFFLFHFIILWSCSHFLLFTFSIRCVSFRISNCMISWIGMTWNKNRKTGEEFYQIYISLVIMMGCTDVQC